MYIKTRSRRKKFDLFQSEIINFILTEKLKAVHFRSILL